MQSQFKALSLSYKKAPLEIRERYSLSEGDIEGLLLQIKDMLEVQEAMIVSTCNRTEIYYSSSKPIASYLVKLLAAYKGEVNQEASQLLSYFEVMDDQVQAVNHLFRVGLGLESQVVGDLQITNQVKRAYQTAANLEMAGPFLHRVMHTIFFANKRVVQETSFRDGAASVSYATVEMIEEVCQSLPNPKVLVVGVGEIGGDVVKNLADSDLTDVTITNRTISKAEALAAISPIFKVRPLEELWEAVEEADVVISSVSMSQPLFNSKSLKKVNSHTFKCFFDLSVPRSVAPDVDELPNALVYNVDDINNRTSQAVARRKASVPAVEMIIKEAIEEFENWAQSMVFSPTIQKLKQALDQIRQEEITRHSKKLSDAELKAIDKISKGMMQKIIKLPVLQIKAACKRGEAETLVDVLNDLFNLEAASQPVQK